MNIYVDKNAYPDAYRVLINRDSKQVWCDETNQPVEINAAHYATRYAGSPADDCDGVGLSRFGLPAGLPPGTWLMLIRNNASPANTDAAVKAVEFTWATGRGWQELPAVRVY